MYDDGTYLEANPTWHVEDSPWKAQQIEKILARNNLAPSSICEVGCGAGEILRQLSLRYDARLVGYEISPQAFSLCKERESPPKLTFVQGDLTEREEVYDLLLCIDVFEHVEDYLGFLRKIRDRANRHVFHIPLDLTISSVLRNAMLNARESVGHLYYFTPETAIATLKDTGYKIIDQSFTPGFEINARTIKAKIARLPRQLLFKVSPSTMAKWVGGASLLVLTEA